MRNMVSRIMGLASLVAVVIFIQSLVIAQSEKADTSSIVGVWRTVVTPRICATGAPIGVTFPGILMFDKGGTMSGTSTAVTSLMAFGIASRDRMNIHSHRCR